MDECCRAGKVGGGSARLDFTSLDTIPVAYILTIPYIYNGNTSLFVHHGSHDRPSQSLVTCCSSYYGGPATSRPYRGLSSFRTLNDGQHLQPAS